MNELLSRPMIPSDIVDSSSNVTNITQTYSSSFGYTTTKADYTTTQNFELVYTLFNEGNSLYIPSRTVHFIWRITNDIIFTYEISYYGLTARAKWYNRSDYTFNSVSSASIPDKFEDLFIFISKEKNEDGSERLDLKIKTGEISKSYGYDWEVTLIQGVTLDGVQFGLCKEITSPSTSSMSSYNIGMAKDISTLSGGSSQIIDPSLSTKKISQYVDGSKIRFLTEDMVVDPTKIDVSKAITLNEDAPKILTDECLI